MYLPPAFREDRTEQLQQLMREHPLATLVTLGPDGLVASHVPLVYEPVPDSPGRLHGHLARANPQWRDLQRESEVLAIFHGPQAYISPSWYATKRSTGRVVPTWNYAAVHAYGSVETYTDAGRLRKHVASLTALHEENFSPPWRLEDAPEPYIAGMLNAIAGIDITITRLQGKWKMSQNRPAEDREGVVQGLLSKGGPERCAIAQLVRDYAPDDGQG